MKIHHAILTLGLLSLLSTSAQADESSLDRSPGSLRPGFYAALDLGAASADFDDNVLDRLQGLDVDISGNASGGGFAAGYSFENDFALELQIYGAELSTGNTGIDSGLGEIALSARAPVFTQARMAPYLEGRVGGAGLVFSGDTIEELSVAGASMGVGAGAEYHLNHRWAVDFGYRFTMINFQQETLETKDGTREVEIDGSGTMHRFLVRATFSF